MADGTGATLYYVAETDVGVTPDEPNFKELPFNSDNIEAAFAGIESERLGGRHRRCFRLGNASADGTVASYMYPGTMDDMLAAAMFSDWNSDTLKIGETLKTFTLNRVHSDTNPDTHIRFRGMVPNEVTISATPDQYVDFSLGFVGSDSDSDYTELTGASYDDVGDVCPFTAFEGSLEIDSKEVASATQVDVSINNNVQNLYGIGSRKPYRKEVGKVEVSGEMTLEFTGPDKYQKFKDEKALIVVLELELEGQTLTITVPSAKIETLGSPVENDGQITQQISYRGEYHAGSESELVIERGGV